MSEIWTARADRYSELRSLRGSTGVDDSGGNGAQDVRRAAGRIEMSYIGG